MQRVLSDHQLWVSYQDGATLGWAAFPGCFVEASKVSSVWRQKTVVNLFFATQTHFCKPLGRSSLTLVGPVKGQLRLLPGMGLPGF